MSLAAHVYRLGCRPVQQHHVFVPRRLRVVVATDAYADHLRLPHFAVPHMRGILFIRVLVDAHPIAEFEESVGWHMTNFMAAEQLLVKIRAFSHAQAP